MEITIKHITLLILSLISILKVFGQSWDVTILGTVTDLPSKKPIEHQRIVLMSNNDTLAFQFTKGIGDFSIETFFSVENEYYLFLDADYQNSKKDWIKLHAKGDTTMIHMFHIDLVKLPIIQDRFDNNAYYEINETKEHQNFDLTYFLNLFTENPTICIRFVQTIHPDEKKRVALRRKKSFLKELEKSGVNMQQIVFSEEISILDLEHSKDKRSRIEGAVFSLDGNCH